MHVQPGGANSNSLQPKQLARLLHGWRVLFADLLGTLLLKLPCLAIGDLQPLKLPQQPLPQGFRQRSAVPLPQLLELLGKVPVDFDCQATTSEQALNPIGLTSGLTLECEQLAVQLASVFFRGRGNLDHAPELRLPAN